MKDGGRAAVMHRGAAHGGGERRREAAPARRVAATGRCVDDPPDDRGERDDAQHEQEAPVRASERRCQPFRLPFDWHRITLTFLSS